MECLAVTGALGVFTRHEAEGEYQLDQVGDMTGFGVGGDGRCGHDELDNANGGGLFSFDRKFLNAVGLKLAGEASVQSGAGLGVWRFYRVGKAIQEVGHHNLPPRLKTDSFPSWSRRPLD